jgi:hypothetical protein
MALPGPDGDILSTNHTLDDIIVEVDDNRG